MRGLERGGKEERKNRIEWVLSNDIGLEFVRVAKDRLIVWLPFFDQT